MKPWVRYTLIAVAPIGIMALCVGAAGLYLREWRRPDLERFGSTRIGDAEWDVRAKLGPTFRE